MAQFPNTTAADGIWTLKKVRRAILGDNWPEVIVADQFFANTVLLLQADDFADGSQNNTFLDSSTNAHTITRVGNVTQGSFSPFSQDEGKWGNYFDGTGDDLVIGSDASFAYGTGDFTWEVWVYMTEDPAINGTYILDHGSNGGSLIVEATAGGTVVRYYNSTTGSSGSDLFDGAVLTMNAWNHVVACRESGTTRLFVNGVLGKSGADSHNYGTQSLTIGDYGSNGYSFAGQLSNLRLVNGTALYTSAFTPPTEPLTAITNTSLLTCQSNRFVDNSSNAHSITVNGDPEVTPFSPFAPSTAYDPATKGGSGYWDGSEERLSVSGGSSLNFGTGDLTVECWVYPRSFTSPVVFSQIDDGGGRDGVAFGIYSSTNLWWLFGDGSNWVFQRTPSFSTPLNAWTHLAVTRSGSTAYLFANGVQIDTVSNSTSLSPDALGLTYLGGPPQPGYDLDGNLSDLRVVKGTALYTSSFTPPTAPLTAVSGTSLLCNFTNSGIYDGTGRNVLETVGDAQVDTAVKKYGTGSMQFDGTGDWLLAPQSEQFAMGTGDFTVECWFYASASSTRGLFHITTGHLNSVSTGIALGVSTNSGNPWRVYHGTTATDTASNLVTGSWQHIAIVRNGSAINIYLDGTSIYTATDSSDLSSYDHLTIGAWYSSSFPWNGYIDDFRITKGVARYTANFTPPAAGLPIVGE